MPPLLNCTRRSDTPNAKSSRPSDRIGGNASIFLTRWDLTGTLGFRGVDRLGMVRLSQDGGDPNHNLTELG